MKRSETPDVTRSMRVALEDLRLDQLWVVYPGAHRIPLDAKITAVSLAEAIRLPRA